MPGMPVKSRKKSEPVIEPIEDDEPEGVIEEDDSEPVEEETPPFEEETITFKRSHFYSALSVLTFFAGILVGYIIWGTGLLSGLGLNSSEAAQIADPVVEAPVTPQTNYIRYDVPTEGFYARGPSEAPITIVEFSDYQCPFCRRWHDQVSQDLFAAYPGKIRLVFRNLPLTSIHPDAFSAAEAAMCAGEQDAYWEFHDRLFGGELLGTQVYLQYARDLGLDLTPFEACLNDRKYQAEVQADSDFALNLGVRSTPTFFINGLAIVGAQPLDVFKQVIDKELAGEIPK
jgi:protein-disulfide isomerase